VALSCSLLRRLSLPRGPLCIEHVHDPAMDRRAEDLPRLRLRQARGDYRAEKERVAERARQRRAAAGQRAAERERQRAQERQQDMAPSAPSVPSGTCSETSQTDFPVPPGDPRDRDGDGIACES